MFNAVLVFATRKNARPLDNGALAISSLVLTAFVSVLLFSEGNMPFIVTDSRYFGDDGTLSVMASARSMNALLEHWAMAIHPPTLFIATRASPFRSLTPPPRSSSTTIPRNG